MPDHPHVLVATLGGQPQIVTFTLDLLLQRGFPISEVIVLHPRASAPSRLYRALLRLNVEFSNGQYPQAARAIHFHSQVLEMDGQPIEDITDDAHADGTLDTIHRLLNELKQQGYRIHLSVSGGRRLMALLAISVAALYFDRHDSIWHLSTPESIREQADEGRLMHVPPDAGTRLIQGPFLSLGAYIANPAQPFRSVQEEQRAQMAAQERARCASVERQARSAQSTARLRQRIAHPAGRGRTLHRASHRQHPQNRPAQSLPCRLEHPLPRTPGLPLPGREIWQLLRERRITSSVTLRTFSNKYQRTSDASPIKSIVYFRQTSYQNR